jgi:N-acetylmuramoyl-L-alanine amidase
MHRHVKLAQRVETDRNTCYLVKKGVLLNRAKLTNSQGVPRITDLMRNRASFIIAAMVAFIVTVLLPGTTFSQSDRFRMRTVVIDPGHGGHDPGNLGTGRYKSKEKDVVLDVCMKLGDLIKQEYPGIKVIYTRTTDEFVTLDARAQIANKNDADLFISVHCNAAKSTAAAGSESFVLGLHRSEENLEVAMKENSVILLEEDHEKTYGGFDPNSAESIIALTMMQSAFLDQSVRVSAFVQRQFTERVGRKDRGVKQAGFLVLRKATMPSILIELGFLTNAAEEDFLNSADGKDKMALAIFKGFKEYKITVEDAGNQFQDIPAPQPKPEPKPEPKAEVKNEVKAEPKKAEPKKTSPKAMTAEEAEIEFNKKRKAELEAKLAEAEKEKERALAEKKKKELDEKERQAKAEREAAEKLAAEKKAEEERIAIEKAELEQKRMEDERKLADARKADEERLRAEKLAEEERLSLEKLEAARIAEEQRLAEMKKAEEEAEAAAIANQAEKEAERQRRRDAEEGERIRREQAERMAEQEGQAAEQRLEEERQAAVKAKTAQIEEERKAREARLLAEQANQTDNSQPAPDLKQAEKVNAPAQEAEPSKAHTPEEAEAAYLAQRRKELEGRISTIQAEAENKKQAKAGTSAEKPATTERTADEPKAKAPAATASGLVFRIQIMSSDKRLAAGAPQFKGQKAEEYTDGNLFKYTIGSTTDINAVGNLQKEVRAKGFEGAFAVAFHNGKRITMQEARDILSKK